MSGSGTAGAATAGTGTAGAGMGGTEAPSTGVQALPAVTDYAKAGPFKTTMTANVGPGNNYTIFRPEPLGANGFLHSPIIFGPGIATMASFYSAVLTHFASHGFVTICVNSMSGGPGDPGNLKAMQDGLEWIIAQNAQAGVFQGKLAVDRAVAMGYSIGAGASVQLSSHKAIMTTVVIHDHNAAGDPHGPVLMLTGTMDVIDDMRKTLSTLDEAPAVLVALPIGHLDVLTELAMLTTISPSARYIAPITAWLRYWVNGDQAAKRFFWGDNCEMCKSPWITPEPNAKWQAQTL
jgi:dienelactone hydrolase